MFVPTVSIATMHQSSLDTPCLFVRGFVQLQATLHCRGCTRRSSTLQGVYPWRSSTLQGKELHTPLGKHQAARGVPLEQLHAAGGALLHAAGGALLHAAGGALLHAVGGALLHAAGGALLHAAGSALLHAAGGAPWGFFPCI